MSVKIPQELVSGTVATAGHHEARPPLVRSFGRGAWATIVIFLLLGVTSVALIRSTASYLDEADRARASATTPVQGTVIATNEPRPGMLRVSWQFDGKDRSIDLIPHEAGERFRQGDAIELLIDPAHPDLAFPVEEAAFEEPGGYRIAWVVIALLGAALMLTSWLVRLLRWWRGALAKPNPGRVELYIVDHGGVASAYLGVVQSDRLRFQRVVCEPWMTRMTGQYDALVRRCSGIGEMYVVDVPGLGRAWPARTAHRRKLWLIKPRRADADNAGAAQYSGILAIFFSLPVYYLGWRAMGPVGAAQLLTLQASILCWAGMGFT